jgi:hypothetical protein
MLTTQEVEFSSVPMVGNEANIVDEVSQFVRRFVFFSDESLYRLVALWIIGTHLQNEFEYIGYLFACSAGPQSGKSRLLEVLDLLVYQSSGILISPTEAVLFHTAEGHTQLLDEVDSCSERDSLRSVLNAGFRKGSTVIRMYQDSTSGYQPKRHSVFAPRAMAGIGQSILPDTSRDRTFILDMVPQKREERRESFRFRQIEPIAKSLKGKIESWTSNFRGQVRACYDRDQFPYLDHFRDRTRDIAGPLAAILETAYSELSLTPIRCDLIKAVAITRKEKDHLAGELGILSSLRNIATSEDPLIGTATELAAMVAVGEYAVSTTLRKFGFETKSIRKGGMPKHRYSLDSAKLREIIERYTA